MTTIIYTNGRTKAVEETLSLADRYGVAFVVEGKTIHNQSDYYLLTDSGFIVCDTHGFIDYAVSCHDKIKLVLVGQSMPNDAFWSLYQKAKQVRDEA